MSDESALNQIRNDIDAIDDKINGLLAQRAKLAVEVKRIKGGSAVYRPKREADILARVSKEHVGPLPKASVESIYTEIIAACRNLEETLKVAYLGPPGSYSHTAAQKLHGKTSNFLDEPTLKHVISAVEQGAAEVAVVPIENTTEGPIVETQKLLHETDLKISRELSIPIVHNLLSKTSIDDIQVIYAHPQALGQCRVWLQTNAPKAKLVGTTSNSEAANQAREEAHSAAIASAEAAELYDLNILERSINDEPGNQTRFLVLSNTPAEPTGNDKTTTIITLKDKYGSLHDLLGVFVAHKIDLYNLKSQPAKAGLHNFFIEFAGHVSEPHVAKALEEIKEHADACKIIGSYPKEV